VGRHDADAVGGHMKLHTDGITTVRAFWNPRATGTPMHPKCSFLNIDVIDAPRGWCVGSHTHDFFEILHPFSGIYTCALNGTPLSLAPGQTVLVRPLDVHEDTVRAPCSFLVIKFLLLGLRRSSEQLEVFGPGTTPSDLVFGDTSQLMATYQERVTQAVEQPDAVSPFLLDSLTLTLFWELLRKLPRPAFSHDFSQTARSNSVEDRLIELFQSRIHEALSVEEMAAHLGMSVSSLERACRKELRVSAARAFTRFKMEEALELLKFTKTPVKVISDGLGFQNPNHFSKAFSRYFGKPPSAFRDIELVRSS